MWVHHSVALTTFTGAAITAIHLQDAFILQTTLCIHEIITPYSTPPPPREPPSGLCCAGLFFFFHFSSNPSLFYFTNILVCDGPEVKRKKQTGPSPQVVWSALGETAALHSLAVPPVARKCCPGSPSCRTLCFHNEQVLQLYGKKKKNL